MPSTLGVVVPEGDTVWLAARRLHDALAGSVLEGMDLRVPAHATADLTGRRVLEVLPRGKHLLMRFEGGFTLHTHFRMDGTWHLYRRGVRPSGGPQWQIRAILLTARWQAVGYRLPVVDLLPTAQEDSVVGHLGPDLLGPDWDLAEAMVRLMREPRREVGVALLDQRNLAGIGNLYKAELCFLSRITPWMPVGDVAELPDLVARAHRLLQANAPTAMQVTTGDPRPGHRLWVYQRRSCRRCGAGIATAWQGVPPRERITFWCPSCQVGPVPPSTAASSTGRGLGGGRP